MRPLAAFWLLAVVILSAACGSSGSGEDATERVEEVLGGTEEDFCDAFIRTSGDRPEDYVGSTRHVNDIIDLEALAPDELKASLSTYREFLEGGGVDPEDPESNVTSNWPAEVQTAVADLAEYGFISC